MSYSVLKYSATFATAWNEFVLKSKNGTFLFNRNFMDYHNDRFDDFSLMVFDGQKIIAVLPANKVGSEVFSHQGLTYGGFIYSDKIKLAGVIKIVQSVLKFLFDNSITRIHVKLVPFIYHRLPAQEAEYAFFLAQAKLTRRDAMAVIEGAASLKTAPNRMEGVKKGQANSFTVTEEEDFTAFWNTVLVPNLQKKYGVQPVHSLQEITLLKKRFPKNIRLFLIEHNNNIVAGTVLFETENVVHAQYISATEDKNELGSLDYLYHHLITNVFEVKKYFDFGISNEQGGRKLNEGLSFWKESFGARTIVQDFYALETANFILLDDVLI